MFVFHQLVHQGIRRLLVSQYLIRRNPLRRVCLTAIRKSAPPGRGRVKGKFASSKFACTSTISSSTTSSSWRRGWIGHWRRRCRLSVRSPSPVSGRKGSPERLISLRQSSFRRSIPLGSCRHTPGCRATRPPPARPSFSRATEF